MKRCSRCREILPFSDFYKSRQMRDGYQNLCKACSLASRQAWLKANPDRSILRHWMRKHSLSQDEAQTLLIQRKKGCKVCRTKHKVFLDHDAKTGRLRGFLCTTCNTGLGMFKDDPRLLRRAMKYLREQEG